ncbi:succinylglutamate desuccinylase/aspartoacylase family protein [Vogesella fluminis]|uniref:Succinylglutamate desuccinylase/aspartoacylase n=1 Tax=Vogesella fluminis TaxID=1069161 RepID=A0ABQ3H816_9NEIS|nr:succinylglutamate desuccinylase/aspartoacylase family protein [Vogesella fluminis]GHD72012.1 succinylglutamate desuccinylase/aspartoacylase [Vogesella fluminis]
MHRIDHPLPPISLNTARQISSFHFGRAGQGEKVYIQASLHADELPGMLTAWQLKQRLAALEAEGHLQGEVVLVPVANPIGLDQNLNSVMLGRFELASGQNFNRHYPAFAADIFHELKAELGQDARANTRLIRERLRSKVAAIAPASELAAQRKTLMALACDADVVLDLHCDCAAAMHLYTGTPLWEQCEPLARYIGAAATLLAEESGDNPFDEACSQLWWQLRDMATAANLDAAIDMACLAVTIELRGQADVSHALAAQDADAIIAFLQHRGVIAGTAPALPELRYPATPLAGSDSLLAPHPGVVHYHLQSGTIVAAGDTIADIIDPVNDRVTTLRASRPGMLYATESRHYAITGQWLAKVATPESFKTGKLLSA